MIRPTLQLWATEVRGVVISFQRLCTAHAEAHREDLRSGPFGEWLKAHGARSFRVRHGRVLRLLMREAACLECSEGPIRTAVVSGVQISAAALEQEVAEA